MIGSRVRVYLGCSLDGFIAGPDDDLSWLDEVSAIGPEGAPEPSGALEFGAFMADVGALLMGRRTYDVLTRLLKEHPWPYGETPVLVVTHRPLVEVARPTVRPVAGDIEAVVAQARSVAGEGDVYLDGGDLVRQALDAGLVDEMTLTVLPIVLGAGTRLFDGIASPTRLEFVAQHRYGAAIQITARPRR